MSEFKTRLLGFSALAIAFAGLSYGQNITGCTTGTSSDPTIRAEGETELIAPPSMVGCTNDTESNGGAVYVTVSAPITSKSVTVTGGNSDVVLDILAGETHNYYPGTVSGSSVSFSNVTFPGTAFTATVYNIRVNASAQSNPQVTATMLISYSQNGSVSANVPGGSENVAYVLPSLSTSLLTNGSNQVKYYDSTTSSFTTCAGEPLGNNQLPAFTLNIKELFSGAFKTKDEESGLVISDASNLAATTGVATQATQLQVALANIPSAATVYLPTSVVAGNTMLTLQINNAAAQALTSPSALVGLAGGVYGFSPANGMVTATYAVTVANSTSGNTYPLQVFIQVAKNAAPVQTTAMTALVSYSPSGAVTGPQATIPTFAVSSVTPTNTLTITPCNTTLLFPYVTNKVGFETGIAIANTTTDNLKGDAPGTNSATATTGSCTLNFYGDAATQPAAFVTPTPIGAFDATSGAAPVYANTLTAMSGAADFTGYVIANCTFLDAHGYAFLVAPDGAGTPAGIAQGYLALVTSNSRSATEGGLGN